MKKLIENLCDDALFQLNLAIWLSQPMPNYSIRPIFREIGFRIESIGPLLSLPPDVILRKNKASLDCQNNAKPDLVLSTENKKEIWFIECKRSSFGTESTTAKQARTMLLISGDIAAEVMGGFRGSAKGIFSYFIKSNEMEALQTTIDSLSAEIVTHGLKIGSVNCIGISCSSNDILLEYSNDVRTLFKIKDASPIRIITVEEDTDPRPLYFIPYDPSVFNAESGEKKLCRRILYERFLSYVLSKIGSAILPQEIVFTIKEILVSVTFGCYELWDDKEAKKHIRRLLRDFMKSLIEHLDSDLVKLIMTDMTDWIFKIDNKNNHQELIKQVSKFKPENMDLGLDIEPDLFDDELI